MYLLEHASQWSVSQMELSPFLPKPPPPAPPEQSHQLWRASASLSHFLKSSPHGFLFRLLLFEGQGGEGEGCQGSFLRSFFSCICSYQCHCQSSFLALYSQREHKSWTATKFLVTVLTMNMALTFSRTSDPDTEHGLQ